MQHKHLQHHEHRAISTELGGFPTSPATFPSTVRANRSNPSFRNSITVDSHCPLHLGTFVTTLTSTGTLLHVEGEGSSCSQQGYLPATHQAPELCETHGKPFGSGNPNQQKDLTFHPSQYNFSIHSPLIPCHQYICSPANRNLIFNHKNFPLPIL